MTNKQGRIGNAAIFFIGTLIIWVFSVFFEIIFNPTNKKDLLFVFLGFSFFQLANWGFRFLVSKEPIFVNTSVSLLHSSLASASVVFILVDQWTMKHSLDIFDHEQLVYNTWPWAYQALCLSCGYFAYDQWDMLKNRLYSGWFPSILAHHLILLLCFTLALYRNITINYLILTLICEVHSVFLHIRKIRRMAGIRTAKSKMVKAEWVLSWVTFFLARLIPHLLIFIKLIKDASKFNKGIELPLALFGMIGMNSLNIGLGMDLFKAFKREINLPSKTQSD